MARSAAKKEDVDEKVPSGGMFRASRWQVRPDRVIQLKSNASTKFAVVTKLQRIIDSLSLAAAADVLGVDRSQLDRCRKGKEAISAELSRRITDVEYVLDRALHVMHTDEVGPWLTEPEPLLGGSIPLNVLTLKGTGPVIAALDGVAAGAFA
ncbi:MAG: hypothetical protein JO036_14715 [Candidatus Eremiobacteraeota bacterium]|nr:hypothetical protein [Candidatus Eremiobacteraeota bacterium]